MHGKLIEGILEKAPNPFFYDDEEGMTWQTFNPPAALLEKYGYKPVVDLPPEHKDGYRTAGYHYEETDAAITKVWEYSEIEMTDTAKMMAILGGIS